jgi:hypothetical protein
MALTTNQGRERRNTLGERKYSGLIKTGVKIYQGALLMQNAAGTVQPMGEGSTTAKWFGMALEECLTGNGTRRVECCDNVEIRIFLKTTVTIGHVGGAIYGFDDNAVTNFTTLGPQVGVLSERIAANDGWVTLRQAALAKGTT